MSDDRQWRGPWGTRERPPWWPENEPFPPTDWRRSQARYARRMGCAFFFAFVFFALVVALFATLIGQIFSASERGIPSILIGVLGLIVLFTVLNTIRRIVMPLGDIITAAERIERGDYSARVSIREHGPRELRALGRAFNSMSGRLERSEAERTRLLADVTHELRTPLTVMQGNVEAFIDGVHQPDEAHLGSLLEETKVLSRLVDDLRTVSLADAGALALHREPTDVGALVRDTVTSFKARAEAAGVTLKSGTDPMEPLAIDPVRVREVLTNVLANAIRHSSGGVVSVAAAESDGLIAVSVRDTGSGIPADVLPHIFERFTRADDSPGAGLGLAIAKSLVEAHGGTIAATSAPGQGTEVRFTLPRAAAS